MKYITAFAIAFLFATPASASDEKMTDREKDNINIALGLLGCGGGEFEKENNDSVTYEVDDAKCKSGRFDIEFDKNFELVSMSRD